MATRRRRRVSPWLVGLVGIPLAAGVGAVLHRAGLGPFRGFVETLDQEAALEEEVMLLMEENEALEREIEALEPGNFGIEKRAREQLGWSKPGEIVVHIPEKR